ncbi:hypothetical protein HD806DRAFT_405357 [Xylariaceae sp. AK1471]|nr:hypothetical protein HD806DRAFT_405357 [Xylariaceae sp. AK1471]
MALNWHGGQRPIFKMAMGEETFIIGRRQCGIRNRSLSLKVDDNARSIHQVFLTGWA